MARLPCLLTHLRDHASAGLSEGQTMVGFHHLRIQVIRFGRQCASCRVPDRSLRGRAAVKYGSSTKTCVLWRMALGVTAPCDPTAGPVWSLNYGFPSA